MKNNDILIKLRSALDMNTTDMVEVFKLGGIELSGEEVEKMLIMSEASVDSEVEGESEQLECDFEKLESFLNGLITFKRGEPAAVAGQPKKRALSIKNASSVNNAMLKKVKIALSLSGDDMIEVFKEAGFNLTNRELSPLFRVEGHKHYKKCTDAYAMAFLKGLETKKWS